MNPGGLGGNRTRDSLIKSQLQFHFVTSPRSARYPLHAESDMLSSILRLGLIATADCCLQGVRITKRQP